MFVRIIIHHAQLSTMWELFSKNAPKNRKKPLLSGTMITVLLIPQWFDCHDFHENHGVGEHQSKPDPRTMLWE